VFKKLLYPNIFITENTIKIDGITKEKPHKEIITLISLRSLCLFSARAKGIANKQLINDDKKA
tara:strand:- start:602 stop:790 length:189 start_codon:yes stop_codon:yes gene_type:complete